MPHELAESALGVLCGYIGAQVARCIASMVSAWCWLAAWRFRRTCRAKCQPGEGQLGETLRLG